MMTSGFFDLQVNGFAGVDFSSPSLTPESARRACEELIRRGTTAFLPTIITSSPELYARNLPILAELARESGLKKHIPGLHAEGPFISSEPGAVGAHRPAWTQRPDRDFLDRMLEWSGGAIRLLTLAAELEEADALVAYAVSKGIVVSLGHQMAGPAELARAADAGARMVTHFGNGLPNFVHRHENVLWAALAEDRLAVSLICDGHHLPPELIKVVIKAKGVENIIAVSDASPAAGLLPGRYEVLGNQVVLEPSGRLHNPEKSCLVGSSATLRECADYLRSRQLADEEAIVKMCVENPKKLLG